MRIGIMLRAYDRPGGIGVYSQYIVKHLLQIDRENYYLLIYNNRDHIGRYSQFENVKEVVLPHTNPVIWDQFLVPRVVKKWDLNMIFHTKFTVPLWTRIKKVMTVHGASWYIHPEIYNSLDVFFEKVAMHLYVRSADFLIANSERTENDYIQIFNVPAEKIATVHFAAGEAFRPIRDSFILESAKRKYGLPESFILCVMSYDPNKNFDTIMKAYNICHQNIEAHLVIVGKDCIKFWDEYKVKYEALKDFIHFLGWIDQKDLPEIYNLANVFFYPSIYETFGIPVLEAMACGCPVVASNTGSIPEISKGGALTANPFDYDAFAEHIETIIRSDSVSRKMKKRGLTTSKIYSWSKAAKQTLEIFQNLA